ncbi:MAG: hypothetical protein Q6J68_07385 [Thermostichales cyanobacterium SZTDM-1c_bins_54]
MSGVLNETFTGGGGGMGQTRSKEGGSRMYSSLVGLPNGGLLEACVDRYVQLFHQGSRPDRIVFLVKGRRTQELVEGLVYGRIPAGIGGGRIETFNRFVGRVLSEHWGEIAADGQRPRFAPVTLPKDLTQFLLERTCEQCPDHAQIFADMGLKAAQVWDQISSAAYIAAASDLEPEQIGVRLRAAWPDPEEQRRLQQLGALGCCARRLRSACVQLGALDFGTQLYLFREYVLRSPRFWQGIEHLVVAQAEESSAVALKFYLAGKEKLHSGFFAYTIGGGMALTAVPTLMAGFISKQTQMQYLQPPADSPLQFYFGDHLARAISKDYKNPIRLPPPLTLPKVEFLAAETLLEAAKLMGEAIQNLLHQGIPPESIAVITPQVETGLSLTLASVIGEDRLQALAPYPSLVKYPLIRALLTAMELGHPQWGLSPTLSELRVMLEMLLPLDPLRAQLLAEDVNDTLGRTIRAAEFIRFPERIGFDAVRRYQKLRQWLQTDRDPNLPLDFWLQQLLVERLATVLRDPVDQQLFQSLVEAAARFHRAFPELPSQEFINMIRSGQTATLAEAPDLTGKILVATPAGLISQGITVDYQFWFDASSDAWTHSIWRPLYNDRVLTPEWKAGEVFDTDRDTQLKRLNLAKRIVSLCCHCRLGLFVVRSSVNARGEENTGDLDHIVRRVYEEKIHILQAVTSKPAL